MILSRRELYRAWRQGTIRFDPDIAEDQIRLSSIDLRLGHMVSVLKPKPGVVIQPASSTQPIWSSTLIFRTRSSRDNPRRCAFPRGTAARSRGPRGGLPCGTG
jgi:deoxycytidine triphosphate deaminase